MTAKWDVISINTSNNTPPAAELRLAATAQQRPVSPPKACGRALIAGSKKYLRAFAADQRGAFLVFFTITLPVLLGFVVLSVEGSRYVYDKARMSDALEQAVLALTVANKDPEINYDYNVNVAKAYITANAPDQGNNSDYIKEVVPTRDDSAVWRLSGKIQRTSWFPFQGLTASFSPEVSIGNHGAAKVEPPGITSSQAQDVVFVSDFSSSMLLSLYHDFSGMSKGSAQNYCSSVLYNNPNDTNTFSNGSGGYVNCEKKIFALKKIVLKLAKMIYAGNSGSQVGFAPYSDSTISLINGEKFCTVEWFSVPGVDTMDQTIGETVVGADWLGSLLQIPETLQHLMNTLPRNQTVFIPIAEGGQLCSMSYNYNSIELTRHFNEISKIEKMQAKGLTFMMSGLMAGSKILGRTANQQTKKSLIIISDGFDTILTTQSKALFNAGICDRLKNDHNVKLSFVALDYSASQGEYSNLLEQCIGKKNIYESYNTQELEKILTELIGTGPANPREVGRNIDKYN